ncbi:hypothetical protein [uncultured Roseibium sp.]|nr:hypothetical protein [uncultured Roseibium sp.]
MPDRNSNDSDPYEAKKKHRYLKERVENSWFARFVEVLELFVFWAR